MMMSVELSGGTFSSAIFDQFLTSSNQEGLLIGQVCVQARSIITDTDINSQTECLVYKIESSIHCPTLRYFYDKNGAILKEKLVELLSGRPLTSVIGWYRSRQHITLEMSLWERTVHCNFSDYLIDSSDKKPNLLFGIFTCEPNVTRSTRQQSTRFLALKDNGTFAGVMLNLRNLGNTSSEYKLSGGATCGKPSVEYTSVCDKLRPSLIDAPHQTVHSTKHIDIMAGDMCSRLQDLCVEVETSELQVQTLLDQIDALKKTLCSKISQSKNLDLDTQSNSQSKNADLVPDSDTSTVGEPDPEQGSTITEEYLIDLADYAANKKAAERSPIIKVSTNSSDSFEHIDVMHQRPFQSSKGATGDAFSFVDELLGETKGWSAPAHRTRSKDKILVTEEPLENETIIPSSPPASPVY